MYLYFAPYILEIVIYSIYLITHTIIVILLYKIVWYLQHINGRVYFNLTEIFELIIGKLKKIRLIKLT